MNFLWSLGEMPLSRVVIFSAIVGGLYYLVGFDNGNVHRKAIETGGAKKVQIEADLRKVDKDLEEIKALMAAQERDTDRLNYLLGFIPEKLSKVDLMKTVSNEAKAVGVNINLIKDSSAPSSKKGGIEFYEEIGVSLELVGSFAQHMLFLSNLTRLNSVVSVDSLELKSSSGGEGALNMSASILGYRYLGAKAIEAAREKIKSKVKPAAPRPKPK